MYYLFPYYHHHCVVKGSGVGLEGLHNAEHEAEVKADQEKFERRAGVLTYVGQSCLDDDTSKYLIKLFVFTHTRVQHKHTMHTHIGMYARKDMYAAYIYTHI